VAEARFPIGTKFWGLSLLLALCFFLFFWQLGAIPFYERGEPREGLVVWEMYKTGNWVLPIINGDYIPFKPPFFHWVGVLISAVIGEVNELTIRFPSALFATLGVLLVYITATRLWNEKTGRFAAVVLATTPGWWRAATIAQVDLTLAFFMTAALLLFYLMYREGTYPQVYSMAVGFLLACATLAKGPVGLLVPLLTICIFLWLRRDFTFLKRMHPVSGAVVYLLVAFSWYALAMRQGGSTFFIRQILEETLGTAAGDYGRHQPLYYFVPIFFLNQAPWSFFSPALAVFLYRRRRELFKDHLMFPLVWWVSVFLFFSLALGKRAVYILPLYPAFALILGAWWKSLDREKTTDVWLANAVGYVLATVSLVAVGRIIFFLVGRNGAQIQHLFPLVRNPITLNDLQSFFTPSLPLWIGLSGFGAASLLIFLSLPRKKWDRTFVAIAMMATAAMLLMKTTYYPAIASKRTLKSFAIRLREHMDPQMPLLFYNSLDYGTIFYSRTHIADYAQNIGGLRPPVFLLMWERDWEGLRKRNPLETLDISEGRGPVAEDRLMLVKSSGLLPIPDEQKAGLLQRDRADSANH
jgi:4-amino-4-deoxy-L-arabinose transferase-like glycosyltransferase